jgi:UDP-N-acetylglucosamine acyltransferase
MSVSIDPTSIVSASAELGDGVEIGPFCTIGPMVRLGAGVRLVSHVSIQGRTSVGEGTVAHPFVSLGQGPQDLRYRGEDTALEIGSRNVFREGVTINLGTPKGRGVTRVGDDGFFMANCHVGHDCILGNNVVMATGAVLGGFVDVADAVNLGGLAAVHQFVRIGRNAMVGGGSPLVGDLIPFGLTDNHGRLNGLNLIGLKRRGFSRESITSLRTAYRELFHGEGVFSERLEAAEGRHGGCAEVTEITTFIRGCDRRPLCLPGRE